MTSSILVTQTSPNAHAANASGIYIQECVFVGKDHEHQQEIPKE